MKNILEEIVAHKAKEIDSLKQQFTTADFENGLFFERIGKSLAKALKERKAPGIIAEFKRKSPSAGTINAEAKVQQVVKGYTAAGAVGVSVLTDEHYFGGSLDDLRLARRVLEKPVLRKDFIIDEFQILEAKANGADVILLIAECLDAGKVKQLATFAKSINLDVLMEIHSAAQLEKLCPEIDIVGVNNRDLTTFNVDLNASRSLAEAIPNDFVKISESGISQPDSLNDLWQHGYKGFLMGGHFMEKPDPVKAFELFVTELETT
ncbi:MAG: indole-3-glycerol phosphate synthase TrpC [Saprospiraceae bacterium]|nr:indole-3-glycerol phosphate synthase TrpC [Saprospiraceae bacterium]